MIGQRRSSIHPTATRFIASRSFHPHHDYHVMRLIALDAPYDLLRLFAGYDEMRAGVVHESGSAVGG